MEEKGRGDRMVVFHSKMRWTIKRRRGVCTLSVFCFPMIMMMMMVMMVMMMWCVVGWELANKASKANKA